MGTQIIDAAKTAYPTLPLTPDGEGPAVPKEAVLATFVTVQSVVDDLQAQVTANASLQTGGRVGFDTKANMDANAGSYPVQQIAEVISDPTTANNGTYIRYGAGWEKLSNFTLTTVSLEVLGARGGSDTLGERIDAIVASTGETQLAYDGTQALVQTYRPIADEARLDPDNPVDIAPTLQPFTVTVPKQVLSRFDADLVAGPTAITFDPVTAHTVTNEAITIVYDPAGPANFPGRRLAYLDAYGLGITRVSDGAPLGSPSQFRYKDGTGMVWGTVNTPDFAGLASYTGYTRRYDRVCINPNTGAISIVKGTNRVLDPQEYRPAEPDGLRTIYWAYVDYRGVILMPVRAFSGQFRNGPPAADFARHTEWCRSRLVKTLGRAARGQTLRIVGYGTSITSQGGSTATSAAQLNPNGDRDKISGYYTTPTLPEIYARMPADTQALYPLYDHGDGLGTVHVHLGHNWYVKKALELLGGTVEYRNFGVGGTTSENSITSGLYNGRHPDRLGPAVADGAHLAVIEFGMNELGQPYTFANVVAIARAFQATGAECIIVTPPMINEFGLRAPIEQWRDTTHQLIEAARATDSAFINLAMLEDVPGYGVSGIHPRDASWVNGFNHPGPTQLAAIGRGIAEILGVKLPSGWM